MFTCFGPFAGDDGGGKGAWGQVAALHLCGLRGAKAAVRCSLLRPRRGTHCVRCALFVRTTTTSMLTIRAAREAASPGLAGRAGPGARSLARHEQSTGLFVFGARLLGAPEARCNLSPHAFADALLVFAAKAKHIGSRQAVPGGGDLWGAEERRPGVGARSALRELTRRGCPNGANAVSKVSSATRPLGEHRRAVGACHRPPKCESALGTACRDAGPIGTTKAIELSHRSRRCEPEFGTVSREGAREMHWPTNGNKIRPANLCPRIDT